MKQFSFGKLKPKHKPSREFSMDEATQKRIDEGWNDLKSKQGPSVPALFKQAIDEATGKIIVELQKIRKVLEQR